MKKAIILQNKFIGDVLVASMIAENLKQIDSEMEVHFFCFEPAKLVLEGNDSIDKIISFNDNELKKFSVLWKYTKQIRAENYDILIDSYAKLQSRFITLFSGAKTRVSYNKPFFKYFYTHTFTKKEVPSIGAGCTAVDDRLMLLSPFTKDYKNLAVFKPNLFLSNEEKENARELLKNAGISFDRKILVLGILGSGLDKTWPINYMAQLINHINLYYDFDLIFNYIPKQQKEVDKLLSQLSNKNQIYTNVLGKDVREFAAILWHCNGIIANEGGAINIAKALRKPSFAIFSPHKFRENWGCYESENQHKSVHLQDFNPEIFVENHLNTLLKNPEPFYKKLTPDKVIPKVDDFLKGNIQQPKKDIRDNSEFENTPKVSALLITKNEEKHIQNYIQDFSFADEIVIVDSISTDSTKTFATQHPKVRFIEREFDNFSNQKNFAISQAKNEWVLFFDADERLTIDLKNEILAILKNPNAKDAYFTYRKFYYKNKHLKYSGWQNDKAIRLFKKSLNQYNSQKLVHETIICKGTVGEMKNRLLHYSFDSEDEYKQKLDLYSKLKAKQLYTNGKQPNWFHFYIKPAFRFLHHYIFRLGILDGKEGFILSKLHADSVKSRYKYLKELMTDV